MTSKVTRWRKFENEQNGVLPCNLACAYLGISRQLLYKLRKQGRIATIGTGGVTYYGMKSLNSMKWEKTAKDHRKKKLHKVFREESVNLDDKAS